MLIEFKKKLQERGITLWLAALNPKPFKVIERFLLGKILSHERMFFDLHQAVENYQAQSKVAALFSQRYSRN